MSNISFQNDSGLNKMLLDETGILKCILEVLMHLVYRAQFDIECQWKPQS